MSSLLLLFNNFLSTTPSGPGNETVIPELQTPIYQVVIRDKQGNILGEITDFLNLEFEEKVNNYGYCSFDLPVDSQSLLTLVSKRRYETLVLRNGSIIWAGEQAKRGGKLATDTANLIRVTSYTFEEDLASMDAPAYVRYDHVDQGLILKDVVDLFQARPYGDRGYTFDDIELTMPRDREYSRQNLLEIFINMSNVIKGPDFYITADKQIKIVKFRGIDQSKQIIFEYGKNIIDVDIDEDFSTPTNDVTVLGSGFGSEQVVGGYADEESKQIYGLRRRTISEIDINDIENLNGKGQSFVRKNGSALTTITFTQIPNTYPVVGSVSLGDTVRQKIRKGIFNIDSAFRIYSRKIRVGDNGEEYAYYLTGQI